MIIFFKGKGVSSLGIKRANMYTAYQNQATLFMIVIESCGFTLFWRKKRRDLQFISILGATATLKNEINAQIAAKRSDWQLILSGGYDRWGQGLC